MADIVFLDAQDTVIEVEDTPGSATYTEILGIESIGSFAAGERTERPRTNLKSKVIETGYGLRNQGNMVLTAWRDRTDPGQAILNGLQTATGDAPETGFKLTESDGTTIEFIGVVISNPREYGTDTDVRVTYTIKVNSDLTETPPAP